MYIVRPGMIRNENGGYNKYNAARIIEMYQVQPSMCIELHNNDPKFEIKLCEYISKGYIFLYPRSDAGSWVKKIKASLSL